MKKYTNLIIQMKLFTFVVLAILIVLCASYLTVESFHSFESGDEGDGETSGECSGFENCGYGLVMLMTNQTSIQEVLFFPQMKPLKEEPLITDDAKVILDKLIEKGECDLSFFKSEFDFSNKKWDKLTKELRGKDLINIYKKGDELLIKPS